MNRLTVAILATVDAAIAVAVGIAATLAPLTVLWVFGFGDTAQWGALWPAGAAIWQFGHAVPLAVSLPGDYVAAAGIDPTAADFVLSLPPLAFGAFTAVFAARSGVRASRAEAWITGVITGTLVVAALSTLVAITSGTPIAHATLWQAVLFPTLFFAVPVLVAAVVTEWSEAGAGAVARLRDRIADAPHGWGAVPALVARGAAVAVAAIAGLGALLLAIALVLGGSRIIGLFEAGHVDALGATVLALAQLAYLPTAAIWGVSFLAGPGFALGTGAAVSAAGTQVGIVPGIPILGAVPEATTPWLLLLALGPVAAGVLAGWIARSRLVAIEADAVARGVLTAARHDDEDPIAARLAVTGGIAILSAGAAALLSVLASGSLGPGRLAELGPAAGPVALAVGLEVAVGAGILLLSPRRRARGERPAPPADAASADDGRTDDRRTDALPPLPPSWSGKAPVGPETRG